MIGSMRTFFTADTLFFHRNIIAYCARPFASTTEMNRAIVAIWNRQVAGEDRVYHLGDVSFGGDAQTFALLARLNGEICLINGNHDDRLIRDPYLCQRFAFVEPYHEMWVGKRLVILCHYPIVQWKNAQRGAWHLHGHTHGAICLPGAAMDVGIDAHPGFRLWSLEEISERLKKRAPLGYPHKVDYPRRVFSADFELRSIDGEPVGGR